MANIKNPTKTKFINGIGVPDTSSAPLNPERGWLWYDSVNDTFKVYNGTTWISQASVVTNLALGTLTTTTIPITNSNGTGFTIPSSTTSLAGVMSSVDKTKLDAITGTNTGNQTLSIGTNLGEITISNGNTIKLISTGLTSSTTGTVAAASSGTYAFSNFAGSTGYPFSAGGVFRYQRTASTFLGAFEIGKASSSTDEIWIRTGIDATTWNNADIIAGRIYVSGLYQTLARLSTTLVSSAINYPNVDAVNTGLALKVNNTAIATGQTIGANTTGNAATATALTTPDTLQSVATRGSSFTGKIQIATAPTNPTDVVRLTDLQTTIKDNNINVTSSRTLVIGDWNGKNTLVLYVDATSAIVTITLAGATIQAGLTLEVIKTDATANAVVLNGGVTNINNIVTYTLSLQNDTARIKSNNTQYYLIP